MKYQQGTFITVPNAKSLRGLKPQEQALFMWLCHYANTTGECFPSYETLAADCGTSKRTVMRSMDQLVHLGFVKKIEQYVEGRQTTNVYYVQIGVTHSHPRGCQTVTLGGDTQSLRTKSIGTKSIETQKSRVLPMKSVQPENANVRQAIRALSATMQSASA